MAAATPCILVVEDDSPLAYLLAGLLREEFGASVDVVGDGRAAAAALAAGAHDLVVLDIRMPAADGLAVLRWLASRPPAARVPVVVCTATGGADRADALRLGADACIAKPFELDELVGVLRRFLAGGAGT
jgi:CheY-like chemotaxis protein